VKALREEIMALKELNPPWEQLKEMKYLNNVIREGMLHPPLVGP